MNLTIVVPVFNEEAGLEAFVKACLDVQKASDQPFDLKFLFVNDGSSDASLLALRTLSLKYTGLVAWISLAKNFGHQSALCAGLSSIDNWPDALLTMDADLEHPPSVIPSLIAAYHRGGGVIARTIRNEAINLPFGKRILSKYFYKIASFSTGLPILPGQADFQIFNADLVRSIKNYLPYVGSFRMLSTWISPTAPVVYYDQHVCPGRVTRFTFRKNVSFALNSILRFSELPMILLMALGAFGLLIAVGYGSWVLNAFINGQAVPGWSSLTILVLLFGSLNLLSLATLSFYMSRLQFRHSLPKFVVSSGSPGHLFHHAK